MTVDLAYVDEAVTRLGRKPDALIPILQSLQEHYGFLPEQALRRVGELTEITAASLSGVSTFYDMFRHAPAGKHIIRVCRGTACHVSGVDRVEEALRRNLKIADGNDTDASREFTIEPVACLGCCTLAPVVKIGDHTYGHATAEKAPGIVAEFRSVAGNGDTASTEELDIARQSIAEIRIGLGSCCMAKGSDQIYHALQESVRRSGAAVSVKRVGCVGMCHRTPMVEVNAPGMAGALYAGLDASQATQIVQRHFAPGSLLQRASHLWNRTLEKLLTEDQAGDAISACSLDRKRPEVSAFLDRQVHIATEGFGRTDPLNLDEYVANGGFEALRRCLNVGQASSLSSIQPPSQEDKPKATAGSPDVKRPHARQINAPERSEVSKSEDVYPASTPADIINAIEQSGLRGRGGAGFPTGKKWRVVAVQPGNTKYVICNGDEGDPGAFMDRMLLESFPYKIIEGLAIAAMAVGAHEGIFYIRHEYPLAVKRVRAAIKLMKARGWLGERLLGITPSPSPQGEERVGERRFVSDHRSLQLSPHSFLAGRESESAPDSDAGYAFDVRIVEGAGAFVCGEETALIASVEGKRGMPRLRPPFPAQQGLWGQPTLINNVETLAMVPWILRHSADKFAAHGTRTSKGTKVFALAGKIQRAGLIEIPMGTTIREIVEDIGGGVEPGRRFKAVQIGGPSGGCVPARLSETPVDYESLREVGAIMGSGGLVVLDDTACMVDIARYFLQFTQNQSCGKCTFCRVGTRRMLDILDRLCTGKAAQKELAELEVLAHQVTAGSLCGLGKTAPNPVLSTLRYFRDEYEAHLQGCCPAGKCSALIHYRITDACTGCTLCAQACPVDAIPMTPYARHEVIDEKCTRCDSCRQACPHNAVEVK